MTATASATFSASLPDTSFPDVASLAAVRPLLVGEPAVREREAVNRIRAEVEVLRRLRKLDVAFDLIGELANEIILAKTDVRTAEKFAKRHDELASKIFPST